MVELMKIMAISFKWSHAHTAELSAPNPSAGHRRPMPSTVTPGHSQAILSCLLWCHCSFFLGVGFCLYPPRVCFPSLV